MWDVRFFSINLRFLQAMHHGCTMPWPGAEPANRWKAGHDAAEGFQHVWEARLRNVPGRYCGWTSPIAITRVTTRPGKRLHNYGKIHHFWMGKLTENWGIFNSYVSHYQRVSSMLSGSTTIFVDEVPVSAGSTSLSALVWHPHPHACESLANMDMVSIHHL